MVLARTLVALAHLNSTEKMHRLESIPSLDTELRCEVSVFAIYIHNFNLNLNLIFIFRIQLVFFFLL